jgi:O-acetyl-ADP-ribose deacetylase (regulator of RNase III)
MIQIEIYRGDILSIPSDAIVNPANRQASMWFGSHINEIIRKKGGQKVVEERKKRGDIELGEAVSTSGGNLPHRYIIHTAILDMYDFNPLFLLKIKQRTSDETLKNAMVNSLNMAENLKIKSVVYSLMGSGIGAMRVDKCAKIMLTEMINFQAKSANSTLEKIYLCVLKDSDYLVVNDIYEKLRLSEKGKIKWT